MSNADKSMNFPNIEGIGPSKLLYAGDMKKHNFIEMLKDIADIICERYILSKCTYQVQVQTMILTEQARGVLCLIAADFLSKNKDVSNNDIVNLGLDQYEISIKYSSHHSRSHNALADSRLPSSDGMFP